MRRLLPLLLLLAPAFAWAHAGGSWDTQQKKIAVFYSTVGGNANNTQTTLRTLNRGGWPYVIFNAEARNWGQAGLDDSTWFRQQGFDAVIIPYMDGQANTTPVASTGWGSQFQNAAAGTGMRHSPLSGRWGIPVFCIAPSSDRPSVTFDDLSGNVYVNGLYHTTPTGTFAPASGTWRCHYMCRLRGNLTDTLWVAAPQINGCIRSNWTGNGGNGSVACLAWAETTYSNCADTAAIAWRWRPTATGPGVYHFVFQTASNNNIATLISLQYIATVTAIRPAWKIAINVMEHNAYPGLLNTVGDARMAALYDTLRKNNVKRWIDTPLGPNEYGGLYTPASLALLRTTFRGGLARWGPFSYDFTLADSYLAADSAKIRQRWNALINTGARVDSFAFSVKAFDVTRVVASSGLASVPAAGKTMVDAGVRVFDTTLLNPGATAGWPFITGPASFPLSTPTLIPDGTGRSVWTQQTVAIQHDSSLVAMKGGKSDSDALGDFCSIISTPTQQFGSIYWHTGGNSGPTHIDPFYGYYMSVFAHQVNLFFNKVCEFSFDVQLDFPGR